MSTVPLEIRKCLYCDAEFMPNRAWQKYCSTAHSTAAHWQRKFAASTAPPADAQPVVVAKLEEFEDTQLDPLVHTAERAAEVERDMPRGKQTAAARALGGLGYDPYAGIPELQDDAKTGTGESTQNSGAEEQADRPQQALREDKKED